MGGEGIIGDWMGLRKEFGHGFSCLETFFLVAMSVGEPFGDFGVGLIGGGGFGDCGGLRSKFGQVFPCLEEFFV